jgi:alpha-tubulin suppressor-like RCC1 family protein
MAQTSLGRKTDGTLWVWGRNDRGSLGLNQANNTRYSSPVQIPGTNWASIGQGSYISGSAIKTDGTLWSWGYNAYGMLGHNQGTGNNISSPTQIPGTNWASVKMGYFNTYAFKTDGTLWVWGDNGTGYLGLNNKTQYSSPIQLPGSWSTFGTSGSTSLGVKTDGTLWTAGSGLYGTTGLNSTTYYSSPVQIPGTNWKDAKVTAVNASAVKTDGTLWTWGTNQDHGLLGLNQAVPVKLSSPTQIGTATDWSHLQENTVSQAIAAFKRF